MAHNEEEYEYTTAAHARQWPSAWRRVSWGAIFAGIFVTLAIFLTLQILGAGIGLTTIDPATGETPSATTLGIGAAIWWLIIGLISLFIGGWVAGRLGWLPNKLDRLLHGLTVWAGFYALMFWLVTTALGAVVGGGLSMLGSTAAAAGEVAAASQQGQPATGQTTGGLNLDAIRQQIAQAVGGGTAPQGQAGQPAQAGQQGADNLASAISDYLKGPRTPEERRQLAQQISQTTGQTEAEANRMITNLEQQAQQAEQAGEQAANISGATLISLAVAMLLGAVAAALGGLTAPQPKPVPVYERERAPEHTYVSH